MGTEPRHALSVDISKIPAETERAERAAQLVKQAQEVQQIAAEAAIQAQRRQEVQANKKRKPADFKVGDIVFLKKKGFATQSPTTRLDSQWAGPFEILEERGHDYVLKLPDSYQIGNLFHADRLRKAATDPLPQQVASPPPPEEINGEAEFEVQKVLRSRTQGKRKTLEYQVDWLGCDPDDT